MCEKLISNINSIRHNLSYLPQNMLIDHSEKLIRTIKTEDEETALINAFALIKEVSWRSLGLKLYDTQLMGGLMLNQGKIIEMKTGEGKTLVSTLPAYLNAIQKKGVHVVTVNEYLAERDQKCMGEVYRFLNISVGLIKEQMTEKEKQSNYNCDITYVTNTEIGFDYLRDNLAVSPDEIVQRPFQFAIVDEVDSILIDEARTPLIISGESDLYIVDKYIQAAALVKFLKGNYDFTIFEKEKSIKLTELGILNIQKILNIKDLYGLTDPWILYILNAIKAKIFFLKNINYIIQDNKIMIVDEFTGRIMPGRRWNDGIHQSIEAKENIPLSEMNQTLASITYQNLFLLYPKLSGMTGTAKTAEIELEEIYNLKVQPIPTEKPIKRKDLSDFIYIDELAKWKAVAKECLNLQKIGRPVLVGTTSVDKSELLSELLNDYNIQHRILNARAENVKRESDIISQAGRLNTVTIATNMAGRGADIPLGGDAKILTKSILLKLINQKITTSTSKIDVRNYKQTLILKKITCKWNVKTKLPTISTQYRFKPSQQQNQIENYFLELLQIPVNYLLFKQKEKNEKYNLPVKLIYLQLFKYYKTITDLEKILICNLGGLYVLGTERHESRRIDNQLRGRAGRQGDPGTSRFFLSLEDNLLRIFGGTNVQQQLSKLNFEPDIPLQSNFLTNTIDKIQTKVEDSYYGSRKQLFKYDEILDNQRSAIFSERRKGLFSKNVRSWVITYSENIIETLVGQNGKSINIIAIYLSLKFQFPYFELNRIVTNKKFSYLQINEFLRKQLWKAYDLLEVHAEIYFPKKIRLIEKTIILRNIDKNWRNHLQQMISLKEAIGWRSYGQVDPLIEYNNDSYRLFLITLSNIKSGVFREIFEFIQ
jgi:preprotein translocase subunit SecA